MEKAGSGAPEPNMQVCPKCYAKNDADAMHCMECGTSFLPDSDADSEIYLELSQANLHRTRGEHAEAIEACLSILRKFPSNFSAHILLGDLHSEMGDFDQAIQWFEMAKDLHPNDKTVDGKIEELRQREREAEKLLTGEPEPSVIKANHLPAYIAAVVAIVIVVAAIAYISGRATERSTYTQAEVVDDPIMIDSSDLVANNSGATPVQEDPETGAEPQENTPGEVEPNNSPVDVPATELDIIEILRDPRGPSIIARIRLPQNVQEYAYAQAAAKQLLQQHQNVLFVNIRLENGGNAMFVADAYRSDFAQDEEGGGVLRNVWPPPTTTPNQQSG